MIVSETTLEVRYYETDLMGIVHHSNYIRYFECGRHQLLLDLGLPIHVIEQAGIMLPVVSTECHYKAPAKMGDLLRIITSIEKKPMARIIAQTKIFNQDETLVCEGTVQLGFIHADTRKPTRAPEILMERIEPYFNK